MAEPSQTQPEPLELPETLGTSVTFADPDRTGNGVTMRGVFFAPGEAVDLAEFLPEAEAKAMARKLAGNPYFRVEGGPDHQELLRKRQEREAENRRRQQEVAQRQAAGQRPGGPTGAPPPPPDWEGPVEPQLESESRARPSAPASERLSGTKPSSKK